MISKTAALALMVLSPLPAAAQVGLNLGGGGLGVQIGPIGANVGTSQGGVNVGANVGSGTNANVGLGGSGLGINLGTPVVGATVGAGSGGINVGVSGVPAGGASTGGAVGSATASVRSSTGLAATGSASLGSSTATSLPSATPGVDGPGMRRESGGGVDFAPRLARSGNAGPVSLPISLAPARGRTPHVQVIIPGMGSVSASPDDVIALKEGIRPRPGTAIDVVQRCRQAAVAGASRYPVARVDAASAGEVERRGDRLVAPIEFRIVYRPRSSGPGEAKQAVARCEMAGDGRVLALR